MASAEVHTCPFCGFQESNDYQMLLHVELAHSEDGDSPFAVRDAVAAASQNQSTASTRSSSPAPQSSTTLYVECPHRCGERIPTAELQCHTDLHMAENMVAEDSRTEASIEPPHRLHDDGQAMYDVRNSFSTSISNSLRNTDSSSHRTSSNKQRRRSVSLTDLFFGSPNRKRAPSQPTSSRAGKIKRLGTSELGPYAHEKRMPLELQRMLEKGAKVTVTNKIASDGTLVRVETVENETPDLVHVLAHLSVSDRTVARAYFCSPDVRHVAKMAGEGGFCGYRNIQMLVSYIISAGATGHEHFQKRLPSIIQLQDMIERAWDMGHNSFGRTETRGIRLTRKYIGTPEAQALLQSLDIPCKALAYSSRVEGEAYTSLMTAVFDYFEDEETRDDDHRVFVTRKPPIYFQHQGHSMTIVGVEVHTDGAANLVVFDPMFNPSPSIKKLVGARSFRCSDPGRLLKAHRRGESYLYKYKDFELLKLFPPVAARIREDDDEPR